jgi:hypothetical protein
MQSGSLILTDNTEHEFAEAFSWLTAVIEGVVPWRPIAVNVEELVTALTAAWDMVDGKPSLIPATSM